MENDFKLGLCILGMLILIVVMLSRELYLVWKGRKKMGLDIKFIKELRAMRKEAQGNKDFLKRKLEGGTYTLEFIENVENLMGVYEDQVETANRLIQDEFNK